MMMEMFADVNLRQYLCKISVADNYGSQLISTTFDDLFRKCGIIHVITIIRHFIHWITTVLNSKTRLSVLYSKRRKEISIKSRENFWCLVIITFSLNLSMKLPFELMFKRLISWNNTWFPQAQVCSIYSSLTTWKLKNSSISITKQNGKN